MVFFLFQSSDKQKRSKTVSIFKTGSTLMRYNLQLCFLMWAMNLIFNIKLIKPERFSLILWYVYYYRFYILNSKRKKM